MVEPKLKSFVSSLLRLRTEAETLLLRLSTEFTDSKEKLIFILNNYDLLITVHEVSFVYFFYTSLCKIYLVRGHPMLRQKKRNYSLRDGSMTISWSM
jgi:hypothetical protein